MKRYNDELKSKDPFKNWVHILLSTRHKQCWRANFIISSTIRHIVMPVTCKMPKLSSKQNSRYNFLISILFLSIYFVIRSGFTFICVILIHTSIWNVATNMAIAAINTVSAKLLSKINTGFLDKKPSLKHHKIRFNFKRWAEDIS